MGFVTGDAPQPGETPRNEGEPWSYSDPEHRLVARRQRARAGRGAGRGGRRAAASPAAPARADRRGRRATRPPAAYGGAEPAFAPEAFDAHAAGVQDVAQALDPPPAVLVEAEQEDDDRGRRGRRCRLDAARRAPWSRTALERHHDAAGRRASAILPPEPVPAAEPQAQTEQGYAMSTADETTAPEPPRPDRRRGHRGGDRRCPTWRTGRRAYRTSWSCPSRSVSATGRRWPWTADRCPGSRRPAVAAGPDRSHATEASIEAARQRMENSPFWLTDEERAAAGAPGRRRRSAAGAPRTPARQTPARAAAAPQAALAAQAGTRAVRPGRARPDRGVLLLGQRGTVLAGRRARRRAASRTVSRCTGSGVTQRCTGTFAAADGASPCRRVALLGVDASSRDTGAVGAGPDGQPGQPAGVRRHHRLAGAPALDARLRPGAALRVRHRRADRGAPAGDRAGPAGAPCWSAWPARSCCWSASWSAPTDHAWHQRVHLALAQAVLARPRP